MAALRTLSVAVALAIVFALAPASSGADKGDARRGSATQAQPARQNAARYVGNKATKRPFRTLSQLRSAVADEGTVRVIVGLDSSFTPEARLSRDGAAAQRAGIKSARRSVLGDVAGTRYRVVRRFSFIPYVAMEVSAEALARLEASDSVTSIVEDAALPATLDSSVPIVQAPEMWAAGFTGAGQTVAVLDTGVESSHSFLAGKVVEEACYSANGNCPNMGTSQTGVGAGVPCTYAPDECRHGTHVAGIAAGTSGSFSGVAKSANIIAIQVFSMFTGSDCSGGPDPCTLSYNSDQLAGLQRVFALRDTYDIPAVNISIGGGQFFTTCDFEYPAYKDAITSLRAADIATVIAAGNDFFVDSMGFPACISNAISVASSTDEDGVSSFSNNSFFTSIMAPGSSINSSVPGNAFAIFDGTSMATPHVVGAWALLRQAHPTVTVGEALMALRATGVPIADVNVTVPRINIKDASDMIGAGTTPLPQILNVSDSPDPFTPEGPKKKIVKIFWDTPQYMQAFSVTLYKPNGDKLKTLAKGDIGIGFWLVTWNGKKGGKIQKAGKYKYVLKGTDDAGNTVQKSGKFKLNR